MFNVEKLAHSCYFNDDSFYLLLPFKCQARGNWVKIVTLDLFFAVSATTAHNYYHLINYEHKWVVREDILFTFSL